MEKRGLDFAGIMGTNPPTLKSAKSKLGVSSHLEMIISFTLFTMFVLFLFLYIKPYKSDVLSDSIVLGLHESFVRESGVNLTKIFLKRVDDAGGAFAVDLKAEGIGADGGSLVKEIGGGVVGSGFSDGKISIDSPGTYFYVFISPEFIDEGIVGGILEEEQYVIGSVEKTAVLSDKNMIRLKSEYESDYEGVKRKLDVPDIIDFSIQSADGEYVMERGIPGNLEVMTKVFVNQVLDSDGNIENKEFVVGVW